VTPNAAVTPIPVLNPYGIPPDGYDDMDGLTRFGLEGTGGRRQGKVRVLFPCNGTRRQPFTDIVNMRLCRSLTSARY
jgi:hypothetical protein